MRASRRGGRSDPVSSRLYRPGDDPRLIDRHASMRLAAARGCDGLIVREHFAEEAARVVVLTDPSPSMQLYPSDLPWLHKPEAVTATVDVGSPSLAAIIVLGLSPSLAARCSIATSPSVGTTSPAT